MKLLIALVFAMSLTANGFIAEDKKKHIAAGTLIYMGCLFTAGIAHNNNVEWINAKTCLVPVLTAAVGKEVYDKHSGGTAEFSDITATMALPTTGFIIYDW